MNERTMRDRFHALAPLVLRVGVALVLFSSGLQRASALFAGHPALPHETIGVSALPTEVATPATLAAATADGLQFNADWGTMLGVGEMAAAFLLFLGILTRLVALPILGMLSYGLFVGFEQASLPSDPAAMWPLAAACLSLFVSGAGCFAVRRRRRATLQTPDYADARQAHAQPRYTPPHATPPSSFVSPPRGRFHRIKNWFARRTGTRRAECQAVAPARKPWPWRKRCTYG